MTLTLPAMWMTILHTWLAITWMILLHSLSKQASNGLFQWLKNNLLQSNADKRHLLVSTNDKINMNVDRFKIDKSDTEIY